MPLQWALVAVPFLIGLNAFFVVSEYAVVAVRPAEVQTLRTRGNRRAADAIEALKADPASAIGAIQVCITMTNLLLGWIGEPAMSAVLHKGFDPVIRFSPTVFSAIATALSFVVVTLLTVVFSELLPKALTLRYVVTAAALTAVPVQLIRRATSPIVWLMNFMANLLTVPLGLGRVEEFEKQRVTPDELRLLTTQAAADGSVSARESSLVLNSLAIGRKRAKEIMVPRTSITYLELQRTAAENLALIEGHLYSRLPLVDGGMDHVIGVVRTKEALTAFYAQADNSVLGLIAEAPVFVPEHLSLDRLLETFHQRRTQMVFLVDEYGGVEGLVTLQDVIDELLRPPDV
jgi:CBS domain containing-hemolysin-like protein